MNRTAVNPWDWSLKFSFNQGEIIDEASRFLVCSGQTAIDGDGNPQHAGDMKAQMGLALDNLEGAQEPLQAIKRRRELVEDQRRGEARLKWRS